jgi:DUF4097 and DUF4098 domain-containing protein YvlB
MMNKVLVKSVFTVALLAMLLAVPVYGASVNKSIKVAAGAESDGETSVNGSITVGEGAVVTGTLKTVNGKVRIGDNAKVESVITVNGSLSVGDGTTAAYLETVNGSVSLGENSTASGDIEAVNGRISLAKGSEVGKGVSNINGDMSFDSSVIGGNVSTVNGNVELKSAATIKGDLIIEKPSMWSFGNKNSRVPEIVIGPGSTVVGVIRLEREVKLYISESAEVGGVEGEMSMDDAVRFSGDRP